MTAAGDTVELEGVYLCKERGTLLRYIGYRCVWKETRLKVEKEGGGQIGEEKGRERAESRGRTERRRR